MGSHPWTPGVWRVETQSITQARAWQWGVHHDHGEGQDRTGHDIVAWEIENHADAELIALAPEMAQAILGMADVGAKERLWALNARLRAIGDKDG